MRIPAYIRVSLSLVIMVCLFSPILAIAGEGKKNFKEGLKHEAAEQWDKAVEAFALAVADNPKNPEYKLHYQRALFNASQMYVKKANSLAEQKDYVGAYTAFKMAYAYDQTNELAKAQMERMFRLQQELENPDKKENGDPSSPGGASFVKASYQNAKDEVIPARLEKLRDVPFPSGVDLQYLIRELAKDLDLNVLFDEESFRSDRKVKIELKNVTAAKALDYLFMQTGLFFQKVGPKTIIVATNNRRTNFQQLVLRTFYLANADPADVAKVIQQAIPPQPGRTPTGVLTDKSTNSLTLRDTEENIRLMAKLIRSLDKDRAEVVMDVNIYEVSKKDLLQFGNQIGTGGENGTLFNLGGTTTKVIEAGSSRSGIRGGATRFLDAFGLAIGLPTSSISALQSKSNTKLLASTQVHAFNGEKSTAKIGQRVPVRSASFAPVTGNNNNNNFLGDVINYEQTGLTLEFEPIVFPNQDVQVKMKIESRDRAGALNGNPIFGERAISGSARIQNNRTLLLASVAQTSESKGRTGLPLLGMIPIIGRLFTAPEDNNEQTDIVIAVTPRVLRAPTVLPEDEIERPTGSLATPTSGSLEAMIIQEEREEQLAAARRLSNVAKVQLPDQKPENTPVYTANNTSVAAKKDPAPESPTSAPEAVVVKPESVLPNVKPIDSSAVKTLMIGQTSEKVENEGILKDASLNAERQGALIMPTAQLMIFPELASMKAGEKVNAQIFIKGEGAMRSAVLGIGYDPKKVAIRKISYGDIFGEGLTEKQVVPYFNSNGKLYVALGAEKEVQISGTDVLAIIEIEALADGIPEISFLQSPTSLTNDNGQSFVLNLGK